VRAEAAALPLLLGLLLSAHGHAIEPEGEPVRSATVSGTAVVGIFSLGVLDESWGGTTCRWCRTNSWDRGVRGALVWSEPRTAATLSDGLLIGVPATSIALGYLVGQRRDPAQGLTDALVVVESAAIATFGTMVVKLAAARQRPYAAYRTGVYPSSTDQNRSFWSGHTSLTFSAAAAVSTIAYRRGSPAAPFLTLGLGLGAVSTGALRIAADKHWFSDVVAGAVFGTVVGIVVPCLELRADSGSSKLAVTPMPLGIAGVF